jgi:DNA-binding IclR family transcriptional regulator
MGRRPPPDYPPSGPTERRSIQSVVAGFALIRALEIHAAPMALKDLAAAAGMAPGRAHAYLASFCTVGLVAQAAEGGRYALGPYALALGLAALGRLDVREAAAPAMRRLRDAAGEAVHLSVWSGAAPVIVARLDGELPVPLTIRVGFALPLDASATGRIFAAFLPEAEHRALAGPFTEPSAGALLRRIVQETRVRGLARTDGLLNIGFVAVSAPVFDHEGRLAAARTVLGPEGRLDTAFEGEAAAALVRAAADASEAMGHRPALAVQP